MAAKASRAKMDIRKKRKKGLWGEAGRGAKGRIFWADSTGELPGTALLVGLAKFVGIRGWWEVQ